MDPVLLFALVFTGLMIYIALYLLLSMLVMLWIREHLLWWMQLIAAPVLLFIFTYSVVWALTMIVNR